MNIQNGHSFFYDGWVNLHRVEGGVSLAGNTDVGLAEQLASIGQTGPDGDGRSTGWSYDTTYKPGEVPGELRFFDVPAPKVGTGAGHEGGSSEPDDLPVRTFKRFRWIFFARPLNLDRLIESVQKRQLEESETNEERADSAKSLVVGARVAAGGGVHSEGTADDNDVEHIERPAFSVQISRLDVYTDLVGQKDS